MNGLNYIAEIGCNHQGDIDKAFRMIESAAHAGASIVKFQKRDISSIPQEIRSRPHPNPSNAYGTTYGSHREYLEFGLDEHRKLMEICRENGVQYMSSVWDCESARQIIGLGMDYIKIPSACNLDRGLLEIVCREHRGLVLVSLGMTTPEQTESIVDYVARQRRNKDLVLLVSTSNYPTTASQSFIGEVARLKMVYQGEIHSIGYSGHHYGTAIDCGAVALGATWIERHFTLDNTWKGTDQVFSLSPNDFSRMVTACKEVYSAIGKRPAQIPPFELASWEKLKKLQIKW